MRIDMRKLIVDVRDSHIRNGKKCNDMECPVALAILDQYPNVLVAWVSVGGIQLSLENHAQKTYPIPYSAREFIRDFDRDGILCVDPFQFVTGPSGGY